MTFSKYSSVSVWCHFLEYHMLSCKKEFYNFLSNNGGIYKERGNKGAKCTDILTYTFLRNLSNNHRKFIKIITKYLKSSLFW